MNVVTITKSGTHILLKYWVYIFNEIDTFLPFALFMVVFSVDTQQLKNGN
jgi:hypothetical protein